MTRIEFFFNVDNKAQKVAVLAEMIIAKGRQLYVFVPNHTFAQQLDDYLWAYQSSSFLPHAIVSSEDEAINDEVCESSSFLIDSKANNLQHDDVMINFALDVPVFFSRFLRLIEVVGLDEADKIAARKRFRLYREQGYDIKSFDEFEHAL